MPVNGDNKIKSFRELLKGAVNGGGKAVVLRSSGGDIHLKKLQLSK